MTGEHRPRLLPQKGSITIDSRPPDHPPVLLRMVSTDPIPFAAADIRVEIEMPDGTYYGLLWRRGGERTG